MGIDIHVSAQQVVDERCHVSDAYYTVVIHVTHNDLGRGIDYVDDIASGGLQVGRDYADSNAVAAVGVLLHRLCEYCTRTHDGGGEVIKTRHICHLKGVFGNSGIPAGDGHALIAQVGDRTQINQFDVIYIEGIVLASLARVAVGGESDKDGLGSGIVASIAVVIKRERVECPSTSRNLTTHDTS